MHANTSLLQEVGTGEEIEEGFGDIRGSPPPSSLCLRLAFFSQLD